MTRNELISLVSDTLFDNVTGEITPLQVKDLLLNVINNTLDTVTPELFGAKGDGVTDDTAAIQSALNYLSTKPGKKKLILTKTYKASSIEVVFDNVIIAGEGTLLDCDLFLGANSLPRTKSIDIQGITLAKTTLSDDKNGISYRYITGSSVRSVAFKNCDKSIYSMPIDYVQHANRISIMDCDFDNCNYNLYCDKVNGGSVALPTGDIHMVHNMRMLANKSHVYALGLDGFEFVANTTFFIGYPAQNQLKSYNIFIDEGRFINITANNLFEAGLESIILNNCIRTTVANNQIAWPGQRVPSSAIKATYTNTQTSHNWLSIVDNVIDSPTKHGIEIGQNCYGGTVDNNTLSSIGNSAYYYGTDALPTHYLIDLHLSAKYMQITRNNAGYNNGLTATYNFPKADAVGNNHRTNLIRNNWDTNQNEVSQVRELGVASNVTSITVTGVDQINLQQPSATTVTLIGGGGTNGQLAKFVGFNGNTTLQNNATIILKGAVNVTVPNNGIIVLEWSYTAWKEVYRNF